MYNKPDTSLFIPSTILKYFDLHWLTIIALSVFEEYSLITDHVPGDFNLCENGGTCTVDASGTAVCTCNGGWTGANCTGTFKLYRYMVGN
jgi:hypothetical protein